MIRFGLAVALSSALAAQDAESLAGKRVVFLGDSITQAGGYVVCTTYYLEKLNPKKDLDILGLGLASETLSGLSEDRHAGGKFPRPCLAGEGNGIVSAFHRMMAGAVTFSCSPQ